MVGVVARIRAIASLRAFRCNQTRMKVGLPQSHRNRYRKGAATAGISEDLFGLAFKRYCGCQSIRSLHRRSCKFD